MRLSRHLIVHGEHTRHIVRTELGFPRPVHVALHPCYQGWYRDDVSRASARQALGLPAEGLALLYFGYVKPYKGVEDLIRAFRSVPGQDSSLHVVGRPLDATIRTEVERLAAADPRVRLRLAYVADDEVQTYFRAADVVVFPFRETQTSGSLMLALTFGRPVVAPDIATLSEYIDASMGVLYDPRQPDALANALRAITRAPLDAMARNAARRAREMSWDDMAEVHLRAYADICPPGTA
jgi:glycosyltransferase involved in cell wall biosynthesis